MVPRGFSRTRVLLILEGWLSGQQNTKSWQLCQAGHFQTNGLIQ